MTAPIVPTACVIAHDWTVGTAQPNGRPSSPPEGEPPEMPQLMKKAIDIIEIRRQMKASR
eukprot:5656003-Prymnesium_polylepis.3